jgi:hypothetical protein
MSTENDVLPARRAADRGWRFDLVAPLFLRPRRALAQVVEQNRPLWRTPILLLILATTARALLVGSINAAAKAGGEPVLPPGFEFYTPEQQAQFMQAATASNNVTFNYILPTLSAVAGVVIVWLLISWLLHLILTLLGGRGTSQQAINIVAWASLPLVLRAVVQIVAILATDQVIASPGLSGFAPAGEGVWPALLAAALSQIDIYFIWQFVLIAIGARLSSQLRWGRVLFALALTVVIVMALRALPSVILARFGDLTVIQPFL